MEIEAKVDIFPLKRVFTISRGSRTVAEVVTVKLIKNNIFCNISYPFPIHTMKAYKHFDDKKNNLKITKKIAKEIFSLPMYPELSNEKLEKVINVMNRF